jgi:transcriptional regulator with PAS, ATPase and Fis domain
MGEILNFVQRVALQAKLLRVLENQSLRRVGRIRDVSIDIRINRGHEQRRPVVKEGAFRQELYYPLNVIQIVIPPLRDGPRILPLAQSTTRSSGA